MNVTSQIKHASDSSEQRALELEVLHALQSILFVHFVKNLPPELGKLKLDGFAPGAPPVLVEVFAHVGRAKGGQRHKIAHDMTKLLLAEKRLGVPCRKVIAVIDGAAIAHMDKGWDGSFADAFGIERKVVPGFEDRHDAMRAVQLRQRR
jgi:hypothetical protein